MIFHENYQGSKKEVAHSISHYYNDKNIHVIDVLYAVYSEDLFNLEPIHHAIIYYEKK